MKAECIATAHKADVTSIIVSMQVRWDNKSVTVWGVIMFATTILGFTLSAIWLTLLAFVWVLVALIPASIAKSKGHSFILWFIISLLFWWITLFVAFFLKDKNEYTPTPVHRH